jgi:hypothetical protein
MHNATSKHGHSRTGSWRRACATALLLAAALLAGTQGAFAQDQAKPFDFAFEDLKLAGTFGLGYSNGSYGTAQNTDVDLALATVSATTGNFRFTASMPYMRISGRGLVVFDASGNPIVINRSLSNAPDTRTGWGDLNLAASYTIPAAILDGFDVRVTGVTKLPTAGTHRRLSTGQADFGVSVDISHQFGLWGPFVTMGYLDPGKPSGFTLKTTTSISAGTSLELSDDLVAIASYDYDSRDSPLVPPANELFGSLSWVRGENVTLTGYATAGLSAGSPDLGAGVLISYAFN